MRLFALIAATAALLSMQSPALQAKRKPLEGKAKADKLAKAYSNLGGWEVRKDSIRRDVRRVLRLDQALEQAVGADPVFTVWHRHDTYESVNFYLETIPGFYLCGTVDFPYGEGPFPLILCPNGHFRDGRYCREQQLMTGTLASRGAICVSYDLYGWGEGEAQVGKEAHNTPVAQVMQALGTTLILDYMLSRPDVDASRVGITGASGGGNHSILMSTVDDRFTAIAPVVGMSAHFDGGCGCESGLHTTSAAGGTMTPEMLATSAPKPVLIVSDGGDWTSETPKVEYPFIKRIYKFYGAEDKVSNVHLEKERHDMGPSKRNAVYAFFTDVFALDPACGEEAAVVMDRSDLFAFGKDGSLKPEVRKVHMSTGFIEPADEGLRYIYSFDGRHWKRVPGVWLPPEVGTQKVMRDPSLKQGADGIFRLVWTSSWREDYGIGYSSSTDLMNWTPERHIELMRDYDVKTHNVWAPELFYEETTGEWSIAWSSSIPGHFDGSQRMYYTTTKDFETFAPAKLFYDPGYNSIDGAVVKRGEGDYVLAVKDNRKPGYSHIHVSFGPSPNGPWTGDSKPFTPEWAEGPTWVKAGDEWLIYYDLYRQFKYGAVSTKDFREFKDITDEIDVPKAHKHGTAFETTVPVLSRLITAGLVK